MSHTTPTPVTAEFELSLTVQVSGVYHPTRPVLAGDPPEDAYLEDTLISDLIYEETEKFENSESVITYHSIPHSLLLGVDTTSPAVQRLLANLFDFIETEATEALFEAVGDE